MLNLNVVTGSHGAQQEGSELPWSLLASFPGLLLASLVWPLLAYFPSPLIASLGRPLLAFPGPSGYYGSYSPTKGIALVCRDGEFSSSR